MKTGVSAMMRFNFTQPCRYLVRSHMDRVVCDRRRRRDWTTLYMDAQTCLFRRFISIVFKYLYLEYYSKNSVVLLPDNKGN